MRKSLEDIRFMVRDIPYPKELPAGIRHLHTYVTDGGHSILAIPKPLLDMARASGNMIMYEVPLPVKFVLEKGWEEIPGTDMITVDVRYDSRLGVVLDHDDYDEF